MRCLNLTEAVNHPDRLKWPLKRAGKRGENKWERISWDEAYDIIEEKVKSIKKDYGPESIIGMEGTGRNIIWQVPYLTYAGFESPNYTLGFLSGDACYLSRNIPRKKHLKSPGSQKKSLLKQLVSTPKTNRQPSSGVLPSINRTGISAAQAITSLWTITGNVDVPGGKKQGKKQGDVLFASFIFRINLALNIRKFLLY